MVTKENKWHTWNTASTSNWTVCQWWHTIFQNCILCCKKKKL